jgi:CIC family chloride channel protein
MLAATALGALFVLGRALTGESLVLGSGYEAIRWTLDSNHAFAVVAGVFVLRALATMFALGAGGVGGLFIPLVVQGALLGSALGRVFDAQTESLFPLLGVAAFLGAGYRVPLAAIMFVAESTGRPGFVVPGLIAAASSQLLMGTSSVSAYQRDTREAGAGAEPN